MDLINNLSQAVVLLTKLGNSVEDKFFSSNFEKKITELVFSHVNFLQSGKGNDVAQYIINIERSLSAIEVILDKLKELSYLNLVNSSPLLSDIEKILLGIKLEILKNKKEAVMVFRKKENEKSKIPSDKAEHKGSEIKIKPKDKVLTESKKKILDFIKLYPEIRTKDIIYEFNSFSGRTIKRNLTDLLRSGMLKKRVDNKAVFYSVVD